MMKETFGPRVLEIDCQREAERITRSLREHILKRWLRKGAVVALSGGVDSTVVAALCCEALGPERVLGLMLPEKESSDATRALGRLTVEHLGIHSATEDITPVLEALHCYERRDEAVRCVVPEYTDGYRSKLVLPSIAQGRSYRLFSVQVESPQGHCKTVRLTPDAYLGIVAATNFKQRVRKMLEYYHADARHYAVAGTPNFQEYDQGFFVKLGDGAADVKPIAHLYKSQVYQMAEFLGIPEEICARPPTTDTYSLPQTQEDFFFSVPYGDLDLCLWGKDHGIPPATVADATTLTPDQVGSVYKDIEARRRMATYLHHHPVPQAPTG